MAARESGGEKERLPPPPPENVVMLSFMEKAHQFLGLLKHANCLRKPRLLGLGEARLGDPDLSGGMIWNWNWNFMLAGQASHSMLTRFAKEM